MGMMGRYVEDRYLDPNYDKIRRKVTARFSRKRGYTLKRKSGRRLKIKSRKRG